MKKNITKKDIKLYSFDQVFKNRTKEFARGYHEEEARIALAKAIKEARTGKKLTQAAVAKRADMPQSVIARLESGNHSVSLDTLNKVAYAMGKHVELV